MRHTKPGMEAATRRAPRASLYVRLSKTASAENVSKQGMIDDLRAIVAREGFVEVALHVDDGKSGGYRDRPDFLAWVADAREGHADVLLAWDVDRMTREGINVAAALLDVVEGKDPETGRPLTAPVRLLDSKGIDSANGTSFRFQFVIKAEIARAEREQMRDRNRAAAERLRRAGRWSGGTPPFGYRVVDNAAGAGKVLALEPDEVTAIRAAADRILAGEPLGRVARWFNDTAPKPRRAPSWSAITLRQVLTGQSVLGRLTYKGQPIRDEDGHAVAHFPTILTLPQHAALRAALAVREPNPAKGRRRASRLLSGLLACHACGYRLQVFRTTRAVQYRCPSAGQGRECPGRVAINAPLVEAYVTEVYLARFGHAEETERRLVAAEDTDLASLDDAIAATLAGLAKAADAETFARLQRLQAQRAELAATAPQGPRVEIVLTGRTKAEEWEAQGLDGRRDMLARDLPTTPIPVLPPLTVGGNGGGRFDPRRLDLDLDEFPDPADLAAGLGE